MSLKTFLSGLGSKAKAEGSAFVKIAEVDAKELEAKGRIVAIDATTKVKTEVVEFLEKEVTRVHAATDAVKAKFDAVLANL